MPQDWNRRRSQSAGEAEASKIQEDGGRIKRDAYAELADENPEDVEAYRERQQSVATANHLSVVRGHVQFPDLRTEYENARGQSGRVDVELPPDFETLLVSANYSFLRA